jgi:undecaprenyl-diphosphatase
MTFLDAVILGIVEGISEFLPISSTGHLILVGELLGLPSNEFLKSFNIAIQLGAILAVVVLFFRSFFDIEIIKRLIIGFIPTGVIGLAAYSFVKTYLIGNELVVVVSLFVGGIALIIFELWHAPTDSEETSVAEISYQQAALVGIFQSIAIIPGVSRSAATIVGGLLIGIPRRVIVEFSFLLAVPTMAAATGYDLFKNYRLFEVSDIGLFATGFAVSFVVAMLSIKFLLSFVRTHTFIPFGAYRIAVAALFFLVFLT